MSKIIFYGQPTGEPFLGNPRYVFGISPGGVKNWYMSSGTVNTAKTFAIESRWREIPWPFDAKLDPNRGIEPKEVVSTMRINTLMRPGLKDLILDILKEKGITCDTEGLVEDEDQLCLAIIPHKGQDSQLWSTNLIILRDYEILSSLDFIKRVENLSEKKKKQSVVFIEDLIDGYDVQFNPSGSVSIGCQLFDKENIERIIKEIDTWRNFKVVANKDYTLTLSEEGISMGHELISFDDFDKFSEKLKAYSES